MIITALLDLIYGLFYTLTLPIAILPLPSEANQVFAQFSQYLRAGIRILGTYLHLPYLWTLFELVVAVELGIGVYRLVMFVIRKIPMLGIK